MSLKSIYLRTLEACRPDVLVRRAITPEMPRTIVAIGKCAAPLLDGAAAVHPVEKAIVAIPAGYPEPRWRGDVVVCRGGHPDMTEASFEAGERLLAFVRRAGDVLFLVSGGGSACAELPLPPFTRGDLTEVNARLVASGLSIREINVVRKHLSAIKGGRLAAAVSGRSVSLVYSDVAAGAIADVASGPTLADPSTHADAAAILQRVGGCDRIVTLLRDPSLPGTVHRIRRTTGQIIADNATLVATAAGVARDAGFTPVVLEGQIESDVEAAAQELAARAAALDPGQLLIAGGEPTVVRRGSGKGGRCSELAVRFALALRRTGRRRIAALFGSSDGVDGSSGAAGVVLEPVPEHLNEEMLREALARSDSITAAQGIGRAIIIRPTGNNLRDLFVFAADNGQMAHS